MVDIFNSDIDLVKQYLAVNINNEFDTIAPYIAKAWKDVMPILSKAQYNQLAADYADNSTDENHLTLIGHVRAALVEFAYLKYADDGTIQITDEGFTQRAEAGHKSAYQWHVRAFKQARRDSGWSALDDLLTLLSENRDAYEPWSTSREFEKLLSCLVLTKENFTDHRKVSSLETVWAMRPAMIRVQDRIVGDAIGEELLDVLKEAFMDDDLTSDLFKLYNKVTPVIVHLGLEQAAQEMNFILTPEGLKVDTTQPVGDNSDKRDSAGRTDSYNVRMDAKKRGETALYELKTFLNKNASPSRYTSYYNSDLYSATNQDNTFTQSGGGSFFAR